MKRSQFLVAAVFLVSWSVSAQDIFRCTNSDGVSIFSDRVCGETAQRIELKSAQAIHNDFAISDFAALNQRLNRMMWREKLQRKIRQANGHITALESEMNQELNQLRASHTITSAIRMQASATRFHTRLTLAQSRRDQLMTLLNTE